MAKSKQNTEGQVAEYIERLEHQRGEIQEAVAERHRWLTNCRLELPGWQPLNIQIERRLDLLAFAIGQMNRLADDMEELELAPEWDGYKIEDWVADMTARIRAIDAAARLDKIARLDSNLRPLLTEDQKREFKLAALADELAAVLNG